MSKIVEFKSKKQQFKEWVNDVIEANFKDDKQIESALFIWETENNGISTANHSKFNCDLQDLKWIHGCLGDYVKCREFDEYLRNHIQDYLEFINE